MKLKILYKDTGKIDYCYEVCEPDGYKEISGKKYRKFKKTYFKDKEQTELLDEKTFTVIPWEPFELFGVECGKGWYKLLTPIFDYVERYNKDKDDEHKMHICQIKEKYGELRVYMNFYDDVIQKLIDDAEEEASHTCELCGSKEDVGMASEGWLTTECHECMKSWCKEHNRPHRWLRYSDNEMYWVNPDSDDELIDKSELP